MTPVDDPNALRQILARTDFLLLDFDGPVCSVFAGFPAPVVADQLRHVLTDGGHSLPDEVTAASDPFDVLAYAATLGPDEVRYVEAAFTAHEAEAIASAVPTPGAHDLIGAWRGNGLPLSIVSNNSRTCIEAYAALHGISPLITHISAREDAQTDLKPSPYLLNQALDGRSGTAVFVGDSPSDMRAAQAAAVTFIGYANKADKIHAFAGATAIATSMTMLCKAL
ncbi:HAD family hydrolase [Actinokineospora enzanensis]|uniref:HAD family hydrolase n=1 Tax=Actinokineospora enzanensis TaxID=155975 RepID=UPI00037F3EE8|nr:HAD hydrolase-like protein [Actinokineospora enzanensis]